MKKTITALACCMIALCGCKTPEQRAMDQLDEAMKKQAYMMKRMQETMERTAKENGEDSRVRSDFRMKKISLKAEAIVLDFDGTQAPNSGRLIPFIDEDGFRAISLDWTISLLRLCQSPPRSHC